MRHFSTSLSLSALTVVALLLVGCSSQTAKHVTQGVHSSALGRKDPHARPNASDQFIVHADAICRRLNVQLGKTKLKVTMSELARKIPARAELEEVALRELGRLTPPASLARSWRRILAYRRTLALELTKLGNYAKAGKVASVKSLFASKKRMHAALTAIAKPAGFNACSHLG